MTYRRILGSLLALIASFALSLHAQQVKVEDAVARALSSNLSLRERLDAYQSIFGANEADRDRAFRRLVQDAEQTIAVEAARQLIFTRSPNIAGLIADRMPGWSEHHQLTVLQSMLSVPVDSVLWAIPRQTIRSTLQKESAAEVASGYRAVDLAAMILSESSDDADRALLKAAVRASPRSTGLWHSLAASGGLETQDTTLAASVYKDQRSPEGLRLAAASALAPYSSEALTFHSDGIRSFISRWASTDAEMMLVKGFSNSESMKEFVQFREGLRILTSLRFAQTDSARQVTFEFINASNTNIRLILSVIAALRWPELFLEAMPARLSNDERENLLAVVAWKHPRLRAQVQNRVPGDGLNRIIGQIQQRGILGTSVLLPTSVVWGL